MKIALTDYETISDDPRRFDDFREFGELVLFDTSSEEEAAEYKEKLTESFREYNEKEKLPYLLKTSIGFSRWQPGQSLAELTELADGQLYEEKAKTKKKRRKTGSR